MCLYHEIIIFWKDAFKISEYNDNSTKLAHAFKDIDLKIVWSCFYQKIYSKTYFTKKQYPTEYESSLLKNWENCGHANASV